MRRGYSTRSTSRSCNARVLTPNDFLDLVEVQRRLLGFQRRYQQTALPFDWRFTTADLDDLLRRLDEREQLAKAA
jgi:hypothetical protein